MAAARADAATLLSLSIAAAFINCSKQFAQFVTIPYFILCRDSIRSFIVPEYNDNKGLSDF